uniref:Uncharacterized protein n=1 Tax=Rhizophora mucronata TaxID=61149 RepID=A0A2P2PS27_RHIMU
MEPRSRFLTRLCASSRSSCSSPLLLFSPRNLALELNLLP